MCGGGGGKSLISIEGDFAKNNLDIVQGDVEPEIRIGAEENQNESLADPAIEAAVISDFGGGDSASDEEMQVTLKLPKMSFGIEISVQEDTAAAR